MYKILLFNSVLTELVQHKTTTNFFERSRHFYEECFFQKVRERLHLVQLGTITDFELGNIKNLLHLVSESFTYEYKK